MHSAQSIFHDSTRWRELFDAVWPRSTAGDSPVQCRKKRAVRSGHLALIVMIAAAVGGTLIVDREWMAWWEALGLAGAGLLYTGWSLRGTHHAVRSLLCDAGAPPVTGGISHLRLRVCGYFAVQLLLAFLIYFLGDHGQATPLLWLVLLPPVAHAVILLPASGIGLVSLLSAAILAFSVVRWHGGQWLLSALLEFSFAELFTIIFTMLAVNSERSRAEMQRLASSLGDANDKLRAYAVQAEELAATRERNRLAREIHDNLGHYLTVVNVQIAAARAVQARDPVRAGDALDKAQSLTLEGLKQIRASVSALRSSPLDRQPLTDALARLAEESRTAGLTIELEVLGSPRALPAPVELTLYRTGQEGLTNVRKHASASRAGVRLDYRTDGTVRLEVRDDGIGAQAETLPGGFGLLGLRERAQLLGGQVTIQTSAEAGFTLQVVVPG